MSGFVGRISRDWSVRHTAAAALLLVAITASAADAAVHTTAMQTTTGSTISNQTTVQNFTGAPQSGSVSGYVNSGVDFARFDPTIGALVGVRQTISGSAPITQRIVYDTTINGAAPIAGSTSTVTQAMTLAGVAQTPVFQSCTTNATGRCESDTVIAQSISAERLFKFGAPGDANGANFLQTSSQTTYEQSWNYVLTSSIDAPTVAQMFSRSSVKFDNVMMTTTYEYMDHANASFSSQADIDTLTIDFGTFLQNGTGATRLYSLSNFGDDYTIGLDLDSIIGSGDTSVFGTGLGLFKDLAGGSSAFGIASFDTSQIGQFSAEYTLTFSDADIAANPLQSSLTLRLVGNVVCPTRICTVAPPTPEPASWALMVGGFGLIGGALRRRAGKGRPAVA